MAFYDRLFASRKKNEPPKGEYGKDGDAFSEFELGGPDINPDLSGRSKFQVYDEMRFSDPAVRSNLLMYKLPILAAQWTVEPVDESEEAEAVAAAVRQQFGIGIQEDGWLDISWPETVRQALLYLDFGSMFEEIIWGDPVQWEPEEGEARTIRPISRLAPRYPRTIETFQTDGGELTGITQDLPDCKPIPGDKLCYFINEKEGVAWHGTSLLRAMYGPWRLKKALMLSAGIAYDRYSSGVPVVRHPPGQENKAQQIGRNYRVHERAWISLEGPPPPSGDWDIQILGGAGTIADPMGLLRHYDEQIALAALTMFSRLGVTETGSRAVGEVLADPFYLAVTSVARHIRDQRVKYVLRRFVDVNFGPETPLPKLEVSKIEAKNTAAVLQAIEGLAGAGWNMTYREMVDYVAENMGWPAPPEEHPLQAEGSPVGGGGGGGFGGQPEEGEEGNLEDEREFFDPTQARDRYGRWVDMPNFPDVGGGSGSAILASPREGGDEVTPELPPGKKRVGPFVVDDSVEFNLSDLRKIGLHQRDDGMVVFVDYDGTNKRWFERELPNYRPVKGDTFTKTRRSVLKAMVTRREGKRRKEEQRRRGQDLLEDDEGTGLV